MAAADVHQLSVPRLRLSRRSPANTYDNASASSSSQAGPSRLPDVTQLVDLNLSDLNTDSHHDHDEDDQQPTPKMTVSPPISGSSPADTPAARLRALLSRVPTSRTSTTPMPRPHSPSELESDFEPPESTPATPSMARESLKDIFSRALRDPGDTPQKGRRRRNSIDVSEVDASPRVQKERASNKGKRKSLSDEEVENPPKISYRSTTPFKPLSQPNTLDILRERFSNSNSDVVDDFSSTSPYRRDDSNDTATLLRDLNSSRATPPAATSTPQHSLRMSESSQFQFQSNLLDQDSEMQREIDALNSYEGDSGLNQRTEGEPSSNHQEHKSAATARLQTPSPSEKYSSISKPQGNSSSHRRIDSHLSSSRPEPASSHSVLGYNDTHRDDEDKGPSHQQERDWNKPKTPAPSTTPELKHQRSHSRVSINGSPLIGRSTLSRRGSAASLGSIDDQSSKGSSFGSQAEYRERINELERERNLEREREWNKRHPTITRPTSSLSHHSSAVGERSRTRSFPSRPDSAQSHRSLMSPELFSSSLRRHHSFNSSRASSPSGSSRASHDDDSEVVEVVHERERNWNAPRPKWNQHASNHHRNSGADSPVMQSPSSSLHSSQHHPSNLNGRIRADSMKTLGTSKGELPVHHGSASGSKSTSVNSTHQHRSRSPPHEQTSPTPPASHFQSTLQTIGADSSRSVDFPARARSPAPSTSHNATIKSPSNAHSSRMYTSSSGTVRSRAPLSPFVRERTTTEHRSTPRSLASPAPAPSSTDGHGRGSGSVRQSQIPIRSPTKRKTARARESSADEVSSSLKEEDLQAKREDGLSVSDETDAMSQERTPTLRTVPPPLETSEYTPPPPIPSPPARTFINDELRLQNAITSNTRSPAQKEPSPLPSPPAEAPESQLPSFLSTPPRRSSFSSVKLEFKTPSPPKGLPDLPGPPASSEDEDNEDDPVPRWGTTPKRSNDDVNPNWTAMKTPRPPGGYSQSPNPNADMEEKRTSDWTDILPSRRNENEGPNWTAMKTPKPPGAWAITPMPTQRIRSQSDSIETEPEETESHNGLATPVASLSRASSLPAQTPAPPGAWSTTPAARRSILKVRFESQPSELEHISMEGMDESSEGAGNQSLATKALLDTAESQSETDVRISTPEPISPVSPPSRSPRSPRKAPSIRVLDAFGREEKPEVEDVKDFAVSPTPRNKSAVRILDAMGREVEESELPRSESEDKEEMPPLDRREALFRVRKGLDDLMHGLDEMDKANEDAAVDISHIAKLERASRSAREARERLEMDMCVNEAELRHKLQSSRASAKGEQASTTSKIHTSTLPGWRVIVAFLGFQLLLYAVMYWFTVMRAKDIFLATYYDPFYPDLHLYTSRPDTHHYSMLSSSSRASWLSIPGIFFREGWTASTGRILDNLSHLISEWQLRMWEVWGSGAAPPTTAWPPT